MTDVEMIRFQTVADVVEVLGGAAHISRELDLKGPSTVSEMKRRNSIPVRLWPAFIDLAKAQGVDGLNSEALMKAHTDDEPAAA